MPGTDVDSLFLDVLPRLAAGVLVHVHDITLPDAYPAAWAWRGYNEQLLVGALIQGGGLRPRLREPLRGTPSPRAREHGILAEIAPPGGAPETSLWLRKR